MLKGKSVLDTIKERIERSGKSKRGLFYVKAGQKRRIRFLTDLEDAVTIVFHDKWGVLNTPCYKHFGVECPHCDSGDSEIRTRDNFAWSVWDYEAKAVTVFMFKANEKTPVAAMVAMYESYGNIIDRDYVIARTGERLDTMYSVVPMDKASFKVKAAKPLTKKELISLLKDAFDFKADYEEEADDDDEEAEEEEEEEEEDEDEKPVRRSRK